MKNGREYVGNTFNMDVVFRQSPQWKGVLAYNEFSQLIEVHKQPPYSIEPDSAFPRRWTDSDDTRTGSWVSSALSVNHVANDVISRSALVAAEANSYHPVKDYLNGLAWDGTGRLDSWLTCYLGVEESRYSSAVGAKWLIAAVARIFEPGCQVDNTLIFEGVQGTGKSSTLKVLASPAWYTNDVADLGSKDAAQQLPGKWILELAELSAMRKTTLEATKAFLTRSVDHYRPSYGRYTVDVERSCVFAGSTNTAVYLQDEENRRFWPVKCNTIDVPGVAAARDQLWAEATHRYRAKEPWWLDSELTQLAKAEQDTRKEGDPWHSLVATFLAKSATEGFNPSVGGVDTNEAVTADRVKQKGWTVADILQFACGVHTERLDRSGEMRVSKILKAEGWVRKRLWDPKTKIQTWRYIPI